jgi:hypothetical protein
MSDFILTEGDMALFMPVFGAAIVTPKPGEMKGSGPGTLQGKKLCVAGDEGKVSVPGCTYMTPQYSVPGTGTLKISALAGNQTAKKTNTGGKPVLLKGAKFTASFEVQSPAQQPTPNGPVPDSTPKYSGSGNFATKNTLLKGT